MKKWLCAFLWIWLTNALQAQPVEGVDSLHIRYLPEITLVGRSARSELQQMPEIVGTAIYAGKKSSLLVLKNVEGNIATNNMRQVMAKIPGIHIWENDGSGIQIGVASRGLSPNRSWEFNVRQNGYDIAADPYGYPEAYYNPQLQAVQRIEVVRGHGALQYGPHFGGMINYILRDGSEYKKPLLLETEQTIGSYGLYNHFTSLGGRKGKWNYYAFVDRRQANGYRSNNRYFTNAGFFTITFRPTDKFAATLEHMRAHARSQQPGGLTDNDLYSNNRQSLRSRNWMDIDWSTLALRIKYELNQHTRIEAKIFTLLGDRNSVGFLPGGGIPIPDSIHPISGTYAPRNVQVDRYRNIGAEAKWITEYKLGNIRNTISAGLRWFQGNTNRRVADGRGTTDTKYTIDTQDDNWPRNLQFDSRNYALFAEHIFRLGKNWLLIPGVRYEWLAGRARGQFSIQNNIPVHLVPKQVERGFLLGGIGTEFHIRDRIELYANITQAYRPIQFADLSAPPGNDRIDPQLKDARGYNSDLGIRGQINKHLYVDASLYLLQYGNRIGTILEQDVNGTFYNWRTNVGSSLAKGLELFTEYQAALKKDQTHWRWSVFTSYAYNDARYKTMYVTRVVNNQLQKFNLTNNRVENAPRHILRSGATIQYRSIKLTGQFSHVSGAFSDANNTVMPTANAQNGWIPGYEVVDLTCSFQIRKSWSVKAGINNLTDAVYFTRRASGYPGPGALPADGRTGFITLTYRGG